VLGVGLFEVEHDGTPADRGEVLGVVGIADEPGDRMTFGGQDLGEAQRDLSVPSGDDDMHRAQPNPVCGASCRSAAAHRTRRCARVGASASGSPGARATHRDTLKSTG
jgi:hypothetical protein